MIEAKASATTTPITDRIQKPNTVTNQEVTTGRQNIIPTAAAAEEKPIMDMFSEQSKDRVTERHNDNKLSITRSKIITKASQNSRISPSVPHIPTTNDEIISRMANSQYDRHESHVEINNIPVNMSHTKTRAHIEDMIKKLTHFHVGRKRRSR